MQKNTKTRFDLTEFLCPLEQPCPTEIAYWAKNDVTILPGPHIEWLTLNLANLIFVWANALKEFESQLQ